MWLGYVYERAFRSDRDRVCVPTRSHTWTIHLICLQMITCRTHTIALFSYPPTSGEERVWYFTGKVSPGMTTCQYIQAPNRLTFHKFISKRAQYH